MRLDKFLKVSRILKRRTVAQEACANGLVDVNGKQAKSSTKLVVGDKVTVHFATAQLTFVVKQLLETTKKDLAATMYEIVSSEVTDA